MRQEIRYRKTRHMISQGSSEVVLIYTVQYNAISAVQLDICPGGGGDGTEVRSTSQVLAGHDEEQRDRPIRGTWYLAHKDIAMVLFHRTEQWTSYARLDSGQAMGHPREPYGIRVSKAPMESDKHAWAVHMHTC